LTNGNYGRIGFYDFQIFPYFGVNKGIYGSEIPMLPIDSVASAETKTNYFYFDPEVEINKNASSKEEMLL
jgi:hypothetical protein